MKKGSSKRNGRKGGRPDMKSINEKIKVFDFLDINLVILTENQYNTLVDKYGYAIIAKALTILEEWIKTSPIGEKYKGKNNYAHFRSDGWLINAATGKGKA